LFSFGRKSQTEPICCSRTQAQPKFLAIGSLWDEPWQLLHYMRDARNPTAVKKSLVRYLISSMQSQISQARQVSQINDGAFFSPLRWCAYRVTTIKGIFRRIATYVVRNRSWSVALAIAMGLEGDRHELPRIEQYPRSVRGVYDLKKSNLWLAYPIHVYQTANSNPRKAEPER
jgi:hypothetical protein